MAADIVVRSAEVEDISAISKLIPAWVGGIDLHSVDGIKFLLQNQHPFVLTVDETVVSCINVLHRESDSDFIAIFVKYIRYLILNIVTVRQ